MSCHIDLHNGAIIGYTNEPSLSVSSVVCRVH